MLTGPFRTPKSSTKVKLGGLSPGDGSLPEAGMLYVIRGLLVDIVL